MILSTDAYHAIVERSVTGRYLSPDQITAFLNQNRQKSSYKTLGHSVENRPIQAITLGTGRTKILMWSQMHGNESTTTKACLDLINFLSAKAPGCSALLAQTTIMIIPMLNPDGAIRYTRANANGVDLNRDAQGKTQPESRLLGQAYSDFAPDFCFNLHDQRTIYNVGGTNKPATVSFLAPSHDEARSISENRAVAMRLIVAMNEALQKLIPGQVARYDDAFNANCVGDAFQMMGTPTLLFEAGHFFEDYQRERTREYIFHALFTALEVVSNSTIRDHDQTKYFDIPENGKRFFDILVKNVNHIKPDLGKNFDMGILFREELQGKEIHFVPMIESSGNLNDHFGHITYNCLDKRSLMDLKKQRYFDQLIS